MEDDDERPVKPFVTLLHYNFNTESAYYLLSSSYTRRSLALKSRAIKYLWSRSSTNTLVRSSTVSNTYFEKLLPLIRNILVMY